jgi:hypothetical protein
VSAKKYIATCPVHGTHEITQKTRPTICKHEVQVGPRSFRLCRRELLSVMPVKEVQS